MIEVLLARCGSVVSRRELGAAAWPDGMPGHARGRLRGCDACATGWSRSVCRSTTSAVAG